MLSITAPEEIAKKAQEGAPKGTKAPTIGAINGDVKDNLSSDGKKKIS